MNYYLSIDLGATSGRHIVGWKEEEEIKLCEVYRFANGPVQEQGHLVWNLEHLYKELIEGIRRAFQKFPDIKSLAIDTWGADYVLMNGDQEILPAYCYRDSRTEGSIPEVHKIIPFDEIYQIAGYQFATYNTIYQLYDDKMNGRLEQATDYLHIPEYFMYRLCGVKCKEATECSTTSLVNARTREFDLELIRRLGLPERLFPEMSFPGRILGKLLPDVAEEVGGNCDVVLCATHDTESAIMALPMDEDQLYISSGTWSLLGIRLKEPITSEEGASAGYSNEGGLDYICYLTNIIGMWIVEQLRKELCPNLPIDEIVRMAEESSYRCLIDPGRKDYLAPVSMKAAMEKELQEKGLALPVNMGDYFSCAYHSLAANYDKAIKTLERITGQAYSKIYITGGGAKNQFLNHLTEEYTGKQVIPYPIEASVTGSILVQMHAEQENERKG